MRARYSRHTQEFRDDAVRLAEKSPRSLAEIAKGLGIGQSTLHNWYSKAMAKRSKKPTVASAKPSAKRAQKSA